MRVVLILYAVMSVATFAAYGLDKRRAARGAWRVRERTLHLLELLGGVPGAVAAQRVLRHKTRKPGFLAVTWLIAASHVAGWAAWWFWSRP
ncbi:MAG: DUF1294 domain-containing protein [Planctomycetota bacterium]|jgi:uncharacterized membrane protein YsdA (DUF1294 family)